ncbi:BlaI/MecI/CopY family transcriptional regulator [Pseudonocardia sp. K10HN5]|uniref:BlaI/MecI/CopY family transcriptional regulator n=2 Tax=Pseudonocardia acidicola TaxID=2724939 RepID=A0ABX1S4Z5_9PSEU|nr:BlaI/MecI/CopY family transcriptional regulator [Pseudonocardia acidicola]
MNVLLAADTSLTGTEVLRRLAERDPAAAALRQTTILTILSRLQAHGLLTRTRLGRAYSYRPVADKPGLAARRMRRVLDDEADRNAVLARFVNDLSPHDEQVLRRLLTGELDS